MNNHISSSTVNHVAKLANIPVSQQQAEKLAQAFDETIEVVDKLQKLDVSQVQPTYQVTGLQNVLREDEVKPERMFTQDQALANAAQAHQGYFVVGRILAEKDE